MSHSTASGPPKPPPPGPPTPGPPTPRPPTPRPPSAAARKQDRRTKAAALRAEQEARERRRRTIIGAIVAVGVLAIVVAAGIAIQASRNSSGDSAAAPTGVTADGGVVVGATDAPVTVTIYEDFQCPACKAFEAETGPTLADLADGGTVQVVYQPIAFLDNASTDNYSTRALNAAACVLDTTPDAFIGFHDTLFVNQTEEGGAGLTAAQLVGFAADAGADDPSLGECITDMTYEGWTRTVTEAASVAGVTSTPTVLVNGEALDDRTPAGLTAAVQAAAAG